MVLEQHRRTGAASTAAWSRSAPARLVTSSGIFAIVTKMPEADFLSWAGASPSSSASWLVGLGAFIARAFRDAGLRGDQGQERDRIQSVLRAVFKSPRAFLVSLGLKLSEVSWVYMLDGVCRGLRHHQARPARTLMLDAVLYAALVEVITIPLFGYLSDIIGRRPFYFMGTPSPSSSPFRLFWMLDMKSPGSSCWQSSSP